MRRVSARSDGTERELGAVSSDDWRQLTALLLHWDESSTVHYEVGPCRTTRLDDGTDVTADSPMELADALRDDHAERPVRTGLTGRAW
jgi:hypothetical protein